MLSKLFVLFKLFVGAVVQLMHQTLCTHPEVHSEYVETALKITRNCRGLPCTMRRTCIKCHKEWYT